MRAPFLLSLLLLLPGSVRAADPTARIVAREHRGSAPWTVRAESGEWTIGRAGATNSLAVPAGGRVESVAAVGSSWMVAGVRPAAAGGQQIWLRRGDRESALGPDSPPQPMADEPVIVTRETRLEGVAWLEGRDRQHLAVRYAAADGDGLASPVTVAPPGPGSQLALAAATLADGRTLLVWSGFDGHDDEIWAAIGDGKSWSSPQRVASDNDVPDITPDVVAVAGGALVAWNRFDGREYELVVARFDGRQFSTPERLGEPGSLYPSFERSDDGRLAILFRDARRSTWSAVELSSRGKGGRVTRAALPAAERPLVQLGSAGAIWSTGSRDSSSNWE